LAFPFVPVYNRRAHGFSTPAFYLGIEFNFVPSMKFHRERKPSPWLVQNIYLRDTWGQTYYLSRPRRFSLRRFFILVMALFGALDLVLATVLVFAWLLAALLPASTAGAPRAARPITPAVAARTVIARGVTSTPRPTQLSAPTRRPTNAPTARPTQVPPTAVAAAAPNKNLAPVRTLNVTLPGTLNAAPLAVAVPSEPADCTPAGSMPDVVEVSVKLCPNQVYRPFTVRGDNVAIFGDPSSVIHVEGRTFGISVESANVLIQNVLVRAAADAADTAMLLCLYPDCRGTPGGSVYGGGILVHGSGTTIMDSDIAGGVAGIAAEHVSNLKLLNNRLDNSSGWGSYNFAVNDSHFVGNSWSNDNRSCTTPEGGYLPTGCESAGWVCIACQKNIVARNTCTNSGDCFYMNGEGNLTSNYNRFHQNECFASPHNCFEATFSVGNEFVENSARADPASGADCKYPFWVGGSQVIFARNTWNCLISADAALQDAIASTFVPTNIENR
jgi:hypothetical protein